MRVNHTLDPPPDFVQQRIWNYVSRSPLHSLWNLQGIPLATVAKRTWKSFRADNLLGRAAELGFYFLFALFPTLFSASSLLGLAARSASTIYVDLLRYLALVIPTSALGTVLATFNETTAAASSGKLTFGLIASIWSASVGISAIQEALNTVYKVKETRSYFMARLSAIGVTVVLSVIVTLTLACLLGGDFFAHLAHHSIENHFFAAPVAPHLPPNRLAISNRPSRPLLCRHLLLGAQRKATLLAMANARGSHRHPLLAPGLTRPAPLYPLLQLLLPRLWLPRSRHHPSHVVLHHRPHAPSRSRDQQRDRSRRRRKTPPSLFLAAFSPQTFLTAEQSATDRLIAIEKKSGGRLGYAMLDTATGKSVTHRATERFPMCSTFKFLAAAFVLQRVEKGIEHLDRKVVFSSNDLVTYSPITEKRTGPGGMTIAELCLAAITMSDNTAANLLLSSFGGPAASPNSCAPSEIPKPASTATNPH